MRPALNARARRGVMLAPDRRVRESARRAGRRSCSRAAQRGARPRHRGRDRVCASPWSRSTRPVPPPPAAMLVPRSGSPPSSRWSVRVRRDSGAELSPGIAARRRSPWSHGDLDASPSRPRDHRLPRGDEPAATLARRLDAGGALPGLGALRVGARSWLRRQVGSRSRPWRRSDPDRGDLRSVASSASPTDARARRDRRAAPPTP